MPQQTSLADLEERIEELEAENESLRQYATAAHRKLDSVKTGLLELQVSELQAGKMLSEGGVDTHTIENELEQDLLYVGENREYVRFTDPEQVGDEKALAASLPDAEGMCQVEQLRQTWRRGLMELDELGDAETQRAVLLWDNIDTLADGAGKGNRNWRIESEKVRRIIKKHHDVKEGSLYELSRRVMALMPSLTDGVLRYEKDNELALVGKKEAIQDELKPLYEATQLDNGSNIVVRR